jgi:hypothetical protein
MSTTRRRFKQVTSLQDRLTQEAEKLRRQAQDMPPGVRRDELLRKARQTETAFSRRQLVVVARTAATEIVSCTNSALATPKPSISRSRTQ